MRQRLLILLLALSSLTHALTPFSTQDIIDDIYARLTETGEADYEELSDQLLYLAANPIELNTATRDRLLQLPFLTAEQIDQLLLYVWQHPMDDIAELALVPSLHSYDIRDLRPFVYIRPQAPTADRLSLRRLFHDAHHEVTLRTDARNIEQTGPDPVYLNLRYRLTYQQRVSASLTIRRPTGAPARDMQYGGSLRINDIGIVSRLVVGGLQANFGTGLVFAPAFRLGKTGYIAGAGLADEGVRQYNSPDGAGLLGAGVTLRPHRYIELSALYGAQHTNDSLWRHVLGANITLRYRRLRLGLTASESLYSDSLRLRNAAYNTHYFRGTNQAVIALNARYNWGIADLFGELAAAQNSRWGYATDLGLRLTPLSDLHLVLLYRYYSRYFDNKLGYALAETSRTNDENGLYVAADIRLLRHWRFDAYADIFRFDTVKFGIPFAPSWGYDTRIGAAYCPDHTDYDLLFRLRARMKGTNQTFSTLCQFNWGDGAWRLRTQLDANIARTLPAPDSNDTSAPPTFGLTILQDICYSFPDAPVRLSLRLMGFDMRQWDNRIYIYEPDVLYSLTTPALYGRGGRVLLNLRWQIIPPLTLYFRASETLYHPDWADLRDIPLTRSDLHLLLRLAL